MGGVLLLHDMSRFAQAFDVTAQGGVRRACDEWREGNPQAEAICLNGESRTMELPSPVYKDACGLGILHKSGVPAPPNGDTGTAVSLTNQKRIETPP
jgi:hypothetical protein